MGTTLRSLLFPVVMLALFGALSVETVLAASSPAIRDERRSEASLTPRPPDDGTALAVWSGGSVDELLEVAPTTASIFVTSSGQLLGYIPGAPSFVNKRFLSQYPTATLPPSTIVSVRLDQKLLGSRGLAPSSSPKPGPSSSGGGSTGTPTPTPTPTGTPVPVLNPGVPSSSGGSTPAAVSYALLLSLNADRSNAVDLNGATVSGDIYVFVSPDSTIDLVHFFVDQVSASGTPYRTEFVQPYDLGGTGSGVAMPFDAGALTAGQHTVSASVVGDDGSIQVAHAFFTVDSGEAPSAPSTPSASNTPPNAVNDSATTAYATAVTIAVLSNDTDPDGDALTIKSTGQPSHGSAVIQGSSVRYTPASGYSGADSFTYTASDGQGGTDTATVAVQVKAAPPTNIAGVYISAGQSIQTEVNKHPAGTTFVIGSGVHREQSVTVRSGDHFVAEPGAILNGSRILNGFASSGSVWITTTATLDPFPHGVCATSSNACRYRNDVFIDGVVQQQVMSAGEVGPGKWYMNYSSGEVRIGTSPAGRLVEMSTPWHAFSGSGSNVTIEGFIIERYANPAQNGAIEGGKGSNWTVRNNEVRWTHGTGIHLGTGMTVTGNFVHHNGQLGIGGVGNDILVADNEISYNNQLGFDAGWEGGGTKFAETNRLVVRNNYVHHNIGTGLWTDINNINTLYENNRVEWNDSIGIRHEISYAAVIRGNTVAHNGLGFDVWLWGAQIAVQNSSDVEVVGNDVTVPASGGDGIAVLNQDRGTGKYGPWISERAWVHGNVIRYLGHVGQSGVADISGYACTAAAGSHFDGNEYWTLSTAEGRWSWCSNDNWTGFRSKGQEATGVAH